MVYGLADLRSSERESRKNPARLADRLYAARSIRINSPSRGFGIGHICQSGL